MATILKTKIYKSTKDRSCNSCNVIFNYYSINDLKEFLNESEMLSIEKAKENNYTIKKGEKYVYQVMIYDGFQTSCSIPEIFDICIKYKLFDD